MRHHRIGLRRQWLWPLVCLCVLSTAAPSEASQGFSLALPLPPKVSQAGLSANFDCTWSDGYGYLPIRITFTRGKPATSNRRLRIEISNRVFGERQPVVVTSDVDLPAGATTVTKVVPFPRCSNNYLLSFTVWEGGVYYKDLSFENHSLFTTGIGQNQGASVLFVTSKQLDVSNFDFLNLANSYPVNYAGPSGTAAQQTPTASLAIAQIAPFTSLPAADLFDDWINYSSLDLIVIAQGDIENLAANRPKAFAALRDWMLAGGNLCVFGAGQEFAELPSLESRLALPRKITEREEPKVKWITRPAVAPAGWNAPKRELFNQDLQQLNGATVVRNDGDVDEAAEAAQKRRGPKRKMPFVFREAGLGMVVSMADTDPFPGDALEWRWLFNSIGPERWRWEGRHGISINDGNASYDDFMIADVGLPPVKAYRVLITLFVVGIGPLNYWLLRRSGRLHLLLFTVPAAALVVSMGLVAYAVIADGFDTYLRARSYTELDQRTDQAVSWARLSYYAGLEPPNGLLFTPEVAVLPIARDSIYQRSTHALRHVEWDTAQHLERGWVPARTPVQYLSMRPYACRRELRVLESEGKPDCAIENRLDTKIQYLLLRSAADELYFARDVALGGRAVLKPLDTEAKAQDATLAMLNQRSLATSQSPTTVTTTASRLLFGNSRRYISSNRHFIGSAGVLEERLMAAFEQIGSKLSEPRSYVAIVDRPPDVTAGVDGLVERQSLHIILGTW
ncbi:MAG: hypothetical protein AB7O59_03785 [Pirellulales bacterium]